jgi:hypothetical protein
MTISAGEAVSAKGVRDRKRCGRLCVRFSEGLPRFDDPRGAALFVALRGKRGSVS